MGKGKEKAVSARNGKSTDVPTKQTKQAQRIVPNSISVRTDLHRLKIVFKDKNINADGITRMKDQYEKILEKAKKKKKSKPAIDKSALEILEKNDSILLKAFKQQNINYFKPIT